MLFECKHYGVDLGKEPASQLYRYFSVAKARFGVLTDGVIYRFYSDIDEQNKMDARPFLEINMLDVDAILLDNTNRQPICRLYFNKAQKKIGLLNEQKVEDRVAIDSISDIFSHADRIKATVQRYEAARNATPGD